MAFDLGNLLAQFANAASGKNTTVPADANAAAGDVSDHFEQAAQAAPPDLLS